MTVISVPRRLRVAASTLLICVPLVAVEILIVSRAPGWNLPYRRALYWAFAYLLITVPLISWIIAARRFAVYLAVLLGFVWVLLSASLSIRMNFPLLGFFTVGLIALLFAQFYWVQIELTRSFLDPQLSWYQGLPSTIPGLVCRLGEGEQKVELRVSRMDQDGAFVFCKSTETEKVGVMAELIRRSQLNTTFGFKSQTISCVSRPVLTIERGIGIGIQFIRMSGDAKKEVGDFVEVLRGEGYVS